MMRAWLAPVVALGLAVASVAHAEPPTPEELAREVHRIVGAEVPPEACRVVSERGGTTLVDCITHRCTDSGFGYEVTTHLAFRRGRARRLSRTERPLGDTGACGCTIYDPF